MGRTRIAVLASGGGSNYQALHDHFQRLGERRAGDVALVASNRAGAGVLARADRAGVATSLVASARQPDGEPLDRLLRAHDIGLVVLAGYLALVPAEVVTRFAGRIINVHPALLPAHGGPGMYGQRVHEAVIAAGESLSGPTVHFVDEVFDHGAAIAQWPVPVLPADDAVTLAARVLRAEHVLFPRIVQLVAAGSVTLDDRGHPVGPIELPVRLPLLAPALDDRALAAVVDGALAPRQSR